MWIIKPQKLQFGILPIFYILITIITCLQAQDLDVYPQFIYEYESDSEQYHLVNTTVHDFEMGIIGQYYKKKLNIQAYMAYHLIDGVNYAQSQFTTAKGLGFISQDPGLGKNQRNYYISDLKIQYGDSSSYIYLNKWNKHWGPGVRSLTISHKIPTFPHIGFKWTVTDQIELEYFHGQLKSGILDSNYLNYFVSGKSPEIMRNIAGHRLDWKPHKKWNISISELVIYANRSLELAYMLPFIPFFPVQNYLNDTDNILMSADLQYYHKKNMRFYGSLLIDEWSPPYTFDKDNHNWFGWQTGLHWKDIYMHNDQFHLEYTWTDHRIYHHRFKVNDAYSWGYPVGFWAGPHAEEIYADYSFSLGDNHIKIIFTDTKRGEYTESMRVNQYSGSCPADFPCYERFGTFNVNTNSYDTNQPARESKQLIKLSINRKLNEKLDIYVQYNYVDWDNAGFDPRNPISEDGLPDITKHSLGFGLLYIY